MELFKKNTFPKKNAVENEEFYPALVLRKRERNRIGTVAL